uniref:Class I SAM-dependent methyltransferase n=1 Tax=Ignisphaera aggregans TaxID=334771 RepID=A0A7C2ZNH0_9CREN
MYFSGRLQLVSTPYEIVDGIMSLLDIDWYDAFYDLGCGDGRVVVEAAKRGAYGVCIEYNKMLCNIAGVMSSVANVEERVKIICRDMFDLDLSSLDPKPSVVYLYHYPSTLDRLALKLAKELDPGVVIVSLDMPLSSWRPDAVIPVKDLLGSTWLLWVYLIDP